MKLQADPLLVRCKGLEPEKNELKTHTYIDNPILWALHRIGIFVSGGETMATMTEMKDMLRLDNKGIWTSYYLAAAIGKKAAEVYSSLFLKAEYYTKHGMIEGGGWFYCTIGDLYKSTLLKYKSQTSAIKQLIKLGLIEMKKDGLFNKRYFRIVVTDTLNSLIEQGKRFINGITGTVEKAVTTVKEQRIAKEDEKLSDQYEKEYGTTLPVENISFYRERLSSLSARLGNRFKPHQLMRFEHMSFEQGIAEEDIPSFLSYCYSKTKGKKVVNLFGYLVKIISQTSLDEFMAHKLKVKRKPSVIRYTSASVSDVLDDTFVPRSPSAEDAEAKERENDYQYLVKKREEALRLLEGNIK